MKKGNGLYLYQVICGKVRSERMNIKNRRTVCFMPLFRLNKPNIIVKIRNGTLRGVLDQEWDEFALQKYKDGRWHEHLDYYTDIWFQNGKVVNFACIESLDDIRFFLNLTFDLEGKDKVIILTLKEYESLTTYKDEPTVDETPALMELIRRMKTMNHFSDETSDEDVDLSCVEHDEYVNPTQEQDFIGSTE